MYRNRCNKQAPILNNTTVTKKIRNYFRLFCFGFVVTLIGFPSTKKYRTDRLTYNDTTTGTWAEKQTKLLKNSLSTALPNHFLPTSLNDELLENTTGTITKQNSLQNRGKLRLVGYGDSEDCQCTCQRNKQERGKHVSKEERK